MTVTEPTKLPDGRTIELFEPDASGEGPMQQGQCPGCRNGLAGYVGRCASIRELDPNGQPTWGRYTTSYGHYDCVAMLYDRVVASLDDDTASAVRLWTEGTQREMVLYVQRRGREGKSCVVQFVPDASREQRYRFYTETEDEIKENT